MEESILKQLEQKLYKNYKSLSSGYMFIEIYDGIIVLNWTTQNDLNINYYRVNQIINYMKKYLIKQNQEGFIYTATNCIKL